MTLSGVLGDREAEAGFSHGRPSGQDNQVAFLQATQQAIKHGKPGGHPHQPILVAREEVDVIDDARHDRSNRGEVAMDAAFADPKDDLLGAVDDLIDFQALIIGNLGDLTGRGDQPAQDGGAFHNPRIVINIERRRRAGN